MRTLAGARDLAALLVLVAAAPPTLATPAQAQQSGLASAQERLWDAAQAGDTAALAGALADGAVIDSLDTRRSANGRRALNWAAWYDRVDAIRLLVSRGATVNLANLTGFTPLHHAAERGSAAAARVLLEAGADPVWPTNAGETPAQVAVRTDHPEVAAIIEEAAQARR
jgi:ankyrin repeat protein